MSVSSVFRGLAVVATLVFVAAGPAARGEQSAPNSDSVSVRVPISDLNLASQAGARIALRRIRAAAAVVCGPAPSSMELERAAAWRDCRSVTTGRAVGALGSPTVTALYAGRSQGAKVLAASR